MSKPLLLCARRTLAELPIVCRPHRKHPRQVKTTGAPPQPSSGEIVPTSLCSVLSRHSCRGMSSEPSNPSPAAMIRSREYPFAHLISALWTHEPVSPPVNLFYMFFFRKIILDIPKIPRAPEIYI
jgi:hypothetical protein